VHIQDGILPTEVVVGGWLGAAGLLGATLPALQRTSPPRVAMVTSAFFVASLLGVPFLGSSIHLSLIGVTGVILGRAAFPAVLVGIALQYALFAHGGGLTIGVNALSLGSGALLAAGVYWGPGASPSPARAALAAFLGTGLSLTLYGLALLSAGEALRAVAYAAFAVHAPLVVVEACLAAYLVRFLARVRPGLVGALPPVPPPPKEPQALASPDPAEVTE
jgi:cobalt/nickel transport system permease protein